MTMLKTEEALYLGYLDEVSPARSLLRLIGTGINEKRKDLLGLSVREVASKDGLVLALPDEKGERVGVQLGQDLVWFSWYRVGESGDPILALDINIYQGLPAEWIGTGTQFLEDLKEELRKSSIHNLLEVLSQSKRMQDLRLLRDEGHRQETLMRPGKFFIRISIGKGQRNGEPDAFSSFYSADVSG